MSADTDSPSVQLFNKLKWIPFYEENKISSCSLVFKVIQGTLPNYLIKHFIVNNQVHSRNTGYAKFNLVALSIYMGQKVESLSWLELVNFGICYL